MPAGTDRRTYGRTRAAPDDAEQDRVLAPVVHDDEQRDEVQPVADRADELAEQQPDERPVDEQAAIGAQDAHRSADERGRREADALEREQFPLDLQEPLAAAPPVAAVAADRAVAGDDPVARDDEPEGVATDGAARRPRRARATRRSAPGGRSS